MVSTSQKCPFLTPRARDRYDRYERYYPLLPLQCAAGALFRAEGAKFFEVHAFCFTRAASDSRAVACVHAENEAAGDNGQAAVRAGGLAGEKAAYRPCRRPSWSGRASPCLPSTMHTSAAASPSSSPSEWRSLPAAASVSARRAKERCQNTSVGVKPGKEQTMKVLKMVGHGEEACDHTKMEAEKRGTARRFLSPRAYPAG